MRSLLKAGKAAALAAALFFGNASTSHGQRTNEASELTTKVYELFNAGRYADAIPIAQRALALQEKRLGRDHPDVANALNILAALYYKQGRFADAEPLFQRLVAIDEKAV